MRPTHRRGLPAWLAVVFAGVLALSACTPTESGEVDEVGEPGAVTVPDTAPVFPEDGPVPAELVVHGLAHDFTTRPSDQDLWSPSPEESTCAAEEVVEAVGSERLVALGYRPARVGASLNDVELTDAERGAVVDAFTGCVDLEDGFGALLHGDGRITPRSAACVAEVMAEADMVRPLVAAWASAGGVDPFADGSAFARTLLRGASICIAPEAFDWPDVRLPDDDAPIDADAPPGSENSAHPDDVRRSTPTTAPPTTTAAPPGSASPAEP